MSMATDITKCISKDSMLHWSISAIECFKRGCICNGCIYDEILNGSKDLRHQDFAQKCQMKNIVIGLVRNIGRPKIDNIED